MLQASYGQYSRRSALAGPEVWMVIGQSNARGPTTGPTGGFVSRPSIPFWYTSEQHTAVAMADDGLGIDPYATTQGRGLELALGAALEDAGRSVAIHKWVRGGTGLYNNWRPWSPNLTGTTRTLCGEATTTLRTFMDAMIAEDSARVPYVGGVVISQWENDATVVLATGYGGRFARWIARMRAETHPDLPVYWLAPASWQTGGGTVVPAERDRLDLEVRAYALTDPLFFIVETEDYEQAGDNLHFSADGLQGIGAWIAAHALARGKLNYRIAEILRGDMYTVEATAITAADGAPVYRHPLDEFFVVENPSGKSLVNRTEWIDETTLPGLPALRFYPRTLVIEDLGGPISIPFDAQPATWKGPNAHFHARADIGFDPAAAGIRSFGFSGFAAAIYNTQQGAFARFVVAAEGGAAIFDTNAVMGDEIVVEVQFGVGVGAVKLWINDVLFGTRNLGVGDNWTDGLGSANIFEIGGSDVIAARVWIGTIYQPIQGAYTP